MTISTYIINLDKDFKRREYVLELLQPYEFLSLNLIKAVEGKKLPESELNSKFDEALAYKRYGRDLNKGEIGCTLSHFECYKALLASENQYALIVEDDITILKSLDNLKLLIDYISVEEPVIIFLSGDFWYTREIKLSEDYCLSYVIDAVGSYAYLINKSAAELIMTKNIKASSAADNWSLYKSQGVTLKAIRPYLVDANIEEFESTINQQYFGEYRRNMPLVFKLRAYSLAIIKKVLVKVGHFVPKIRKYEYNE